MITASELARQLGVSRGRVSQLVSEGKLDGCYSGEGHGRRFDLEAAAAALNRRLDQGQQLGNGSASRAARRAIARPADPRPDTELPLGDQHDYQLHRAAKVREEARRLRRQNMLEEGTAVLASDAARHAASALQAEIAATDAWLNDVAREISDEKGTDYLETRAILRASWRRHREHREAALRVIAETATETEAEAKANAEL